MLATRSEADRMRRLAEFLPDYTTRAGARFSMLAWWLQERACEVAAGRVKVPRRQHLIIDADDTLWENNIYFERAFDEFCEFLAHSSMSPAEVRAVLDEIEIVNSKIHGYGSKNFGRNLKQCYRKLAEREMRADDLHQRDALRGADCASAHGADRRSGGNSRVSVARGTI